MPTAYDPEANLVTVEGYSEEEPSTFKDVYKAIDVAAYHQVPYWVQHFLVHVVKRSAMILVRWIDDMKEVQK